MGDKAPETFAAQRKRLWAEADAAYDRWFAVPHRDPDNANRWKAGYVSALMDRITAVSAGEGK